MLLVFKKLFSYLDILKANLYKVSFHCRYKKTPCSRLRASLLSFPQRAK
jgi:hypothetical protein